MAPVFLYKLLRKQKSVHKHKLYFKKFNNEICWAVPLSKTKRRGKYYFAFPFNDDITSVAILSQIKLIDAHRLSRKIGDMGEVDFRVLIEKLKALLP